MLPTKEHMNTVKCPQCGKQSEFITETTIGLNRNIEEHRIFCTSCKQEVDVKKIMYAIMMETLNECGVKVMPTT